MFLIWKCVIYDFLIVAIDLNLLRVYLSVCDCLISKSISSWRLYFYTIKNQNIATNMFLLILVLGLVTIPWKGEKLVREEKKLPRKVHLQILRLSPQQQRSSRALLKPLERLMSLLCMLEVKLPKFLNLSLMKWLHIMNRYWSTLAIPWSIIDYFVWKMYIVKFNEWMLCRSLSWSYQLIILRRRGISTLQS